jgi:integral membrane protein
LLEGGTLVLLLFVAVPLKHWADLPEATAWLGPVHGGAFLFYLWALAATAAEDKWPLPRSLIWAVAAMVPFGTFIAIRLRQKRHAVAEQGDVRWNISG